MLKIIFILIVAVWLFVGILGGLHCKEKRVNYEMIVFVSLAPFLPLIAKVCGLF